MTTITGTSSRLSSPLLPLLPLWLPALVLSLFAGAGCGDDRERPAGREGEGAAEGEGEGEGSEGEGEGEGSCATARQPGEQRCSPDGEAVQTCSDYNGDACREWGGEVDCLPGSACEGGRCVAVCQHQCAEGEKICAGRSDVRSCGDTDSDGCRELLPAEPCSEGLRCDGGECVPEAQECQDACAQDGQRTCTGDGHGYQRCGDFDEDDCLDLSVTIPCADDETCRNGECLPDCDDECDVGEVVCRNEGVASCGNFDRDRCLELGPVTPCRDDERCDDGRCVPAVQPCEDGCDEEGARVCTADGTGYRSCGRYDADPCLELSSPVDCGADSRCEAGRCQPTCEDECSPGARRCSAEASFSACGNFDDDGCLEWGAGHDCGGGQRCDDGLCVPVEQPCSDGCDEEGALACVPDGGRLTCANSDADPCLEWSPAAPCGEGQRCQDGGCVSACNDECEPGQTVCQGQSVRTCGDFDDDPCLELSPGDPCDEGLSCVDGECVLVCADDCAPDGVRRCDPAGNGYQVCGAYDADACRDWSSTHPCLASERCSEGVCMAICQDECQPNQRRCVGEGYQVCGNFDADPCREYGGGSSCDVGQACVDGACQVVCDHECAEGAARCADETSRQQCGNFDADPCRDWSSPSACAPTERCEAGGCVARPAPAGVVINEVLYDIVGADPPGVFIELFGPAGTDLRGFRLVGINGNGGAIYATIQLSGSIPPDGYFVIVHSQATAELLAVADQVGADADLQNGPDSVQLRWGDQVVDALGYGTGANIVFAGEGTAAPAVAAGQSLTRDALHSDTGDNSVDFHVADTPTPGTGVACEDECPGEDETRCAGEVVQRCTHQASGCLGWQDGEDCADDGGQCEDGACSFPLGCSLPVGVGEIRTLTDMKVYLTAVDVLPHQGGFAVASGSDSGIHFGLVNADGVLTSGPTMIGSTVNNPWGSGGFYLPSLVRTDQQFGVVWSGYEPASPGNCPLHFRRLTLDGQLLPAAQDRITQQGRSAFNPMMLPTGPDGHDFLVAYNDYRVNRTIRVDSLGNPDPSVQISTLSYDEFLRQHAFSSIVPSSNGYTLVFSQTASAGGTRVYFKQLAADGSSILADTAVADFYAWSSAKTLYLFRISTEPERFGLFWQGQEADVERTLSIHYAILDTGGQIQSRVRLNDLARPDLYLPSLQLRHVLLDGDRFGVVQRREFQGMEPYHFTIQWLAFDGTSQGRTELGEHDGVLARLPEDGLYRLFITPLNGNADLRVARLTCP